MSSIGYLRGVCLLNIGFLVIYIEGYIVRQKMYWKITTLTHLLNVESPEINQSGVINCGGVKGSQAKKGKKFSQMGASTRRENMSAPKAE